MNDVDFGNFGLNEQDRMALTRILKKMKKFLAKMKLSSKHNRHSREESEELVGFSTFKKLAQDVLYV
jgi:hypothetical protein